MKREDKREENGLLYARPYVIELFGKGGEQGRRETGGRKGRARTERRVEIRRGEGGRGDSKSEERRERKYKKK